MSVSENRDEVKMPRECVVLIAQLLGKGMGVETGNGGWVVMLLF